MSEIQKQNTEVTKPTEQKEADPTKKYEITQGAWLEINNNREDLIKLANQKATKEINGWKYLVKGDYTFVSNSNELAIYKTNGKDLEKSNSSDFECIRVMNGTNSYYKDGNKNDTHLRGDYFRATTPDIARAVYDSSTNKYYGVNIKGLTDFFQKFNTTLSQ